MKKIKAFRLLNFVIIARVAIGQNFDLGFARIAFRQSCAKAVTSIAWTVTCRRWAAVLAIMVHTRKDLEAHQARMR